MTELSKQEGGNDNVMEKAAADQVHQCDFRDFTNISCSEDTFFNIYECTKDISCHLRLLHCSEPVPGLCGKFVYVPEAIVLLYRSGIFSIDSSTLKLRIFQKHRDSIGLKWRKNKARCCHQNHNEQSKSKPFRGATPTFCKSTGLKRDGQFRLDQVSHLFI